MRSKFEGGGRVVVARVFVFCGWCLPMFIKLCGGAGAVDGGGGRDP